jgi:hypothetical protein
MEVPPSRLKEKSVCGNILREIQLVLFLDFAFAYLSLAVLVLVSIKSGAEL